MIISLNRCEHSIAQVFIIEHHSLKLASMQYEHNTMAVCSCFMTMTVRLIQDKRYKNVFARGASLHGNM